MQDRILHFKEFKELYDYIGLDLSPKSSIFHVYKFEEFTENSLIMMPPHRKDFFQIAYIYNYGKSYQRINDIDLLGQSSVFYFISPEHTYSWKRDLGINGYILNFKLELTSILPAEFYNKFRFFELNQINFLSIEKEKEERIREIFQSIYFEFQQPQKSFSIELIGYYVLVLLYKCLSEYNLKEEMQKNKTINDNLFIRFKNHINNYYLSKKSVAEYAYLLNITPNHLSETIKETTGKNASHFIAERLLIEAKNLLSFSKMDVKEISYALNFGSASHFGKFFKKNTNQTPIEYRNKLKSEK